MNNKDMKFNQIADLFPLIEGNEFELLCEDIQKEGLNHPIILLDEEILDGRNRYRACIEVDIEPRYEQFKGDDPLAFVFILFFSFSSTILAEQQGDSSVSGLKLYGS